MTAARGRSQAQQENVVAGFLRSAGTFPHRPALVVDGNQLAYRDLESRAASIAAVLRSHAGSAELGRTAIFGHRSAVAFAGVLGALMHGDAYVPLNRTFPVARTRAMLERSASHALVVDEGSLPQLDDVLEGLTHRLLVIVPELEDVSQLAARWPSHTICGAADLPDADVPVLRAANVDAVAYLLFTSGSTGQPKGVLVAHRNVVPFVRSMVERYQIDEHDRFSQTFDLTFDLSVFDMFVAWEGAACIHCLPEKALLKPGGYIREHELTVWFSVPSVAVFMKRFGQLKPDSYPSVRWSLFCGEALPADLAEAWSAAASSSVVENLYGPTEATIACTVYRWDPRVSPAVARLGLVPIGKPTPGMRAIVADDQLRGREVEEEGELLVGGPQVTLGYLNDEERTAAAFVVPPGEGELFYRTGDRVVMSDDGVLHYLGRVDNQIQVHGHRVELGEIEAAIRAESGVGAAVALGWPRTSSGASGVVAFVTAQESLDLGALRSALVGRLPHYMVPRDFHVLPELPVNVNGKIDRRALLDLLEASA